MLQCSTSSISDGGSVTDVGNPFVSGIVVDSAGIAVSGAEVKIYPADHNPITDTLSIFPLYEVSDVGGQFSINVPDSITNFSLSVFNEDKSSGAIINGIYGSMDSLDKIDILLKVLGSVKFIFKDSVGLSGSFLFIPGSNIFMSISTSDIIYENERYAVLFDSIPVGTITEMVLFDGITEKSITDSFIVSDIDTVTIHTNSYWSVYNHKNSSLPNDSITSLFTDSDELLWLGTASNGLYSFSSGEFTQVAGSEGVSINAISEDGDKVLWIGTDRGVYKYSGGTFSAFSIPALPDSQITDLIVDSRNIKWIGTAKGCLKIDSSLVELIDSSSSPLKENYITAISKDIDSTIVICTPLGFGINKNDSWSVYYSGDANCQIEDTIYDVAVNQIGKAYFATKTGIIVFSGSIWYSFNSDAEGITNSTMTAIGIDENNNCWAGTNSPATIYDVGTSYAQKYDSSSVPFLENSMAVISVSSINDSVVFFGTAGNGLIKLELAED